MSEVQEKTSCDLELDSLTYFLFLLSPDIPCEDYGKQKLPPVLQSSFFLLRLVLRSEPQRDSREGKDGLSVPVRMKAG